MIKFTKLAQVRGQAFFSGDTAEFDQETEAAYIRAGQAVAHVPDAEPVEVKRSKPYTDNDGGNEHTNSESPYTRDELEAKTYKELKTLAKGLEAKSQKTDDLIDALLEHGPAGDEPAEDEISDDEEDDDGDADEYEEEDEEDEEEDVF